MAGALLAAKQGRKGVIVPADNAAEAAVVSGVDAIGVRFLSDAVVFLADELRVVPTQVDLEEVLRVAGKYDVDFADAGAPGRSGVGQARVDRRGRREQQERPELSWHP